MLDGLAEVRAASPVGIAVDKRVFSPGGFHEVVHRGAAYILQPDPMPCGAMLECLDMAMLAHVIDLAVVAHVGRLIAVGMPNGLHPAAALEPESMVYDPDLKLIYPSTEPASSNRPPVTRVRPAVKEETS